MTKSAPLVGAGEAGEIAGVSVDTVKRAARTGELPYSHKLPGATGAYLFTIKAVEKWAATRQQVTA